jgi:hypothetical protein
MTPRDSRRFVAALPQVCAPDALVLWTRREGTRSGRIRARFAEIGFRVVDADVGPGILAFNLVQLERPPEPRQLGTRWFTFRPMGVRWPRAHHVRVRTKRAAARLTRRAD